MGGRLAEVTARIRSVEQLGGVMTAMRGIAAARLQQARALLPGIEAHAGLVGRAIATALRLEDGGEPPPGRGGTPPLALVLFCAEQGFAGIFSERILEAAGPDLASATLLVAGCRGAVLLAERGLAPAVALAMATQAGRIAHVADRLAEALYARVAAGRIVRADLVHARPGTGGAVEVVRRPLLPLDLRAFAVPAGHLPPLITLPPATLLARLATEYVFATLCAAAAESFAAENAARLETTAAAKGHVDETLARLAAEQQRLRQEEITSDIVELAAGAEALR
ncbi:F0F1 ATP synthase subunit gamma [Benzoatithermus flavus]|uniref:F0F1 ATP synthase subunit gamma n=1 Tax=Benzoatithermus flavus TaxID=3108223 RepID=A0ABU8XSQ1_9PROT